MTGMALGLGRAELRGGCGMNDATLDGVTGDVRG